MTINTCTYVELFLKGKTTVKSVFPTMRKKGIKWKKVWKMSSKDYIKLAIINIENQVKAKRMRLPEKAITPMDNKYVSELDASPELNSNDITFY